MVLAIVVMVMVFLLNSMYSAREYVKLFGRIVLCGMISQYNAASPTPGPSNISLAITKRLRLQGFIVGDHYDMTNQFSRVQWGSSSENIYHGGVGTSL
jgi:NADPH-dependent curcumin reductase CurA